MLFQGMWDPNLMKWLNAKYLRNSSRGQWCVFRVVVESHSATLPPPAAPLGLGLITVLHWMADY